MRPPPRRCGGSCGAAPRRCRSPASRSWRWRSESSTLNSVEIAITSAPSVTDIGLSGTLTANRISADQPVASTIGTSGTSARRRSPRKARSSTSATADQARPAASPGAATGRRPRARLRRQHRQADEARVHTGGRMQARAHLFDQPLLAVEPHQADAERERRHAPVGRDHVLGEVRRDRAEQAVDLRLRELRHCAVRASPAPRTGRAARTPGTGARARSPSRSCSRNARAPASGSRSSIRSSTASRGPCLRSSARFRRRRR